MRGSVSAVCVNPGNEYGSSGSEEVCGKRGSVSAGCENPGNEYGNPGSEKVCLRGVKIPELSIGARDARKCVCRV